MPRPQRGGTPAKNPVKAMKRVLSIVFGKRKAQFAFIVLCIIIVAFSTVYYSNFLGAFIDGYVTPIIGVEDPDFAPIVRALIQFALIVSVSVVFSYVLQRTMVGISQKTLYDIRMDMFRKLESLPISYFDRNPHGTIMSRFSNDTDTLNQLISNSLVQLMPKTGRTHQLRVHMAYLGCPLVGDWLYGEEVPEVIARPALHACRLELVHPVTGELLKLEAPLPEDMASLL